MKKTGIAILMILVMAMALSLAGCGEKAPYTTSGEFMNAGYEVTIYDEEMDSDTAGQILEEIGAEISRIDNILNHKIEGSDVYKVNHAKGERVEVSQEVKDMMSIGILIGNTTDGAIDMTMGPVNELWGFDTEEAKLPEDAAIKEALEHVFYGDIATQGNQLWLADPEAALDFTYMAKSYAAAASSSIISDTDVKSALIDIDGNKIIIGEAEADTAGGTINVSDTALSTVSINDNTLEYEGKKYHHILDPKTGYPAETDIEAATVIASKEYSKYCSILSAACILLGNTEAQSFILDLAERNPDMGLEVVFLLTDGTIYKTDGIELTTE